MWSSRIVASVLAAATVSRADAADGRCTFPTDCEVRSAKCIDMSCTIVSKRDLFPDQPDMIEIEITEPAQLAQVSSTPEFHWNSPVGVDLIAAAVLPVMPTFEQRSDRISNFHKAVWVWHSNLAGGSVSSTGARFAQGRGLVESVPGSELLTDSPPPPLTPGVYYWGVWAWTGVALTHRSAVRSFVVGVENITGTSCSVCDGVATLRCPHGGAYCIIACASNVDCYQGSTCDLTNLTTGHPWGVCRTTPKGCICDPAECDEDLGLCYVPSQSDNRIAPVQDVNFSESGCQLDTDQRGMLTSALIAVWLICGLRRKRRIVG
jgi:hypothetical protein